MRILILTNLYPPLVIGGYERACANVTRGLVARGHDVRVLAAWSHVPGPPDPPYVRRLLDMRWLLPHHHRGHAETVQIHEAICSCYANSLHLIETLRDFEPDLVYVWSLYGVGIAGLLDVLNQVGVPWAVHLMDCLPGYLFDSVPPHVRDVFNARGAGLWERAAVIAMSQHVVDEVAAKCAIRFPQGVSVIPGWVDLVDAVPHAPYRQGGQKGGQTRFVTAGSVMVHKGIDLIIAAAADLRRRGAASFSIDIFGDGEVPHYVDQAMMTGVGDIVRFPGVRTQPELLHAYAGYDAFLFPTWEREPFGFAPIEAAGCGTPPIMTAGCGAAERLVDGVHCIKIERTSQALADAMAGVIDGTHDVAALGRRAAALVSTDLAFDRCLDMIEGVLASAARPWSRVALDDPKLALLTFVKHELSASLRFG